MFRRALFAEHGLNYRHEFPYSEDYELWTRVAEVTELANLPQVLLRYRFHEAQTSSQKNVEQEETVEKIRLRQLYKIDPHATEAERAIHLAILSNRIPEEAGIDIATVEAWLLNIIKANEAVAGAGGFPVTAFRRAIALVWWRYCSSRPLAPGILRAFYRSELTDVLPLRNKLLILAVRMKAGATRS
jgi:hypothetical protein